MDNNLILTNFLEKLRHTRTIPRHSNSGNPIHLQMRVDVEFVELIVIEQLYVCCHDAQFSLHCTSYGKDFESCVM